MVLTVRLDPKTQQRLAQLARATGRSQSEIVRDALLARIESGDLVIDPLGVDDLPGLRTLLKKYRDVPMDLADATLVRVAEREGIDDIFTLDHHFRVYRTHRRRAFAVIP